MESGVLSLVDDTHATATELLDDPIVRDGLADHWRGILLRPQMQVNESREFDGVLERLVVKNLGFFLSLSLSLSPL